ncbi:MAG TPA: M13 family metallopeptidase [Sediminibacterium sp.]|nr:M13 family metallopeptidase [Sediminibacterium sp.]
MKQSFFWALGLCLLLAACQQSNTPAKHYFDTSGMDSSVRPGNDFFAYANGKWIRNASIPGDQSGWGGYYTLFNDNLEKLRTILDDLSEKKDWIKGSKEQKVGDFYASGMDTLNLEKIGYTPLVPTLKRIDTISSLASLQTLLADLAKEGEGNLIGWGVGADERNSAKNILQFGQAGLTLPEKGYYTRKDSATANIRRKLMEHATRYFRMTGRDSAFAARAGKDILVLETIIAHSHLAPVELRDPVKNYHKMAIADLQKLSPAVNWNQLLLQMGIHTDSADVGQPAYYKALSDLLKTQSLNMWKEKIAFDYIAANAGLLNKAFREENFSFSRLFSGAKKQPERWKSMVSKTDNGLKDLLGQLFAEKYFPPAAKTRMDELVNNLQKALSARIAKLDWMSDTTKQKAQEKLAAVLKKIGYPSKWKSYDDVDISRDDFFGNMVRIAQHEYRESIAKVGKPVDKTEWGMTVPTVNAYYNPTYNEIVFPAGILQFPFFDLKADDAINYGAIGLVIGHEMTHGFDDEGRQYDAQGNLKDWWTAKDAATFQKKADVLVQQYNQYIIQDSLHVNGKLTLGENLADNGGLAIAYDAFKMTEQGKSNTPIDGFTPDQRFFLGFAQAWRIVTRPELQRTLLSVDPHSPEKFRVNGPLSNFDPFYVSFGVKENDSMYRKPADRAKIW